MVPFESDYLLATQTPKVSIALEPVPNILNSFVMLTRDDEFAGLGGWVERTIAELSPERLHINRLVFIGMYFALQPEQRWPSFPACLRCPEHVAWRGAARAADQQLLRAPEDRPAAAADRRGAGQP